MTRDDQIVAAIGREGPMTSAEIGLALGVTLGYARALTSMSKRLRVVEWRRDYSAGGRYYLRAVYGVRTSPRQRDAKKPPRQPRTESNARHKLRQKFAVSSVFQLGVPAAKRRVPVHIY